MLLWLFCSCIRFRLYKEHSFIKYFVSIQYSIIIDNALASYSHKLFIRNPCKFDGEENKGMYKQTFFALVYKFKTSGKSITHASTATLVYRGCIFRDPTFGVGF